MSFVQISRLTSVEQFQELASVWDDLITELGVENIFLCHDWLRSWWEIYSDDRTLWILVAVNLTEIVGIAPLILRHAQGGLRVLEFMGSGDVTPNHLDFLISPSFQLDAIDAFSEFIWQQRSEWDWIELRGLSADTLVLPQMISFFTQMGTETCTEVHEQCPYANLPETFKEYLQILGSKSRKNVRYLRRKIVRENPEIQFETLQTLDEFDMVFDALVSLHQARWKRRGQPGAFASQKFINFHRKYARSAYQKNTLRLYFVRCNDEIIAVQYCYRVGKSIFYYLSGFDEGWGEYSIGTLLLVYAIEQAIGERAQTFDFLQGDVTYKMHWATDIQNNKMALIASPSLRGRLKWMQVNFDQLRLQMKRKLIPHELRSAVKRILGRS